MKTLLGKYSDFLWAVLRVVAACMFLTHGLQKFNVAMLGGFTPPPGLPQLTAAAWIESIGAPLLIIGLYPGLLAPMIENGVRPVLALLGVGA